MSLGLGPTRSILLSLLATTGILQSQQTQDPLMPARMLLGQQKFAEAEKLLRAAVESKPGDARGWSLLGYSLHAQQKYDEALKVHLKAAEFPAVRRIALYRAAGVYARRKDADRAVETLEKAIAAGFSNWGQLMGDPDFNAIRSDARLQKLIPPLLTGDELFAEPTRILHTFVGEAANDQFGWVARRIGDVDADRADDFIATAPTAGSGAGRVYIYSSRSGKLLSSQDGTPAARLGNGAGAAGDVDKDGVPDAVVGAPGGDYALVLAGRTGEVIWTLKSPSAGQSFGYKVSGIADLNGDGHAEVVVTATQAGKAGAAPGGPGHCYVYSGQNGKLLYRISGERKGDLFGSAVAGILSGDHRMLAVGAQDAGANRGGCVYVYRLKAEAAELLFRVDGDAKSRDLGQMFVSFPGDFNKDGVPDVYASDFSDSTTVAGGGRVRVVSGVDGKLILSLTGSQQGEGLGTSPSDAGDADRDGIPDLVVGAWQNAEGAPSGGKVTLFSGKDGQVLKTWTCRQSGDTFGFDAVGIGDVDGDDRIDFLLTSAWSPVHGARTGRVFIIAGE